MRKIRLSFESLFVESFATGKADGDGGAVHGHDSTAATDCGPCDEPNTGYDYCVDTGFFCQPTLLHNSTCQATCPGADTCSYTYCAPTCDHSMTSPCACV